MKVLLMTPPMTQLNTPYPATAYITGFLRQQGITTFQCDPALELFLELFSKRGLTDCLAELLDSEVMNEDRILPSVEFFTTHSHRSIGVIDSVISFLQGKDPSLALRIVGRDFLPEGPRFVALNENTDFSQPSDSGEPLEGDPLVWAFGSLGIQDKAKYLASLFIDDIADMIRDGIDSKFELSRYAEKLAASVPTFEPLQKALESPPTLVDRYLSRITADFLEKFKPDVVGLTVPFPGNVFGALRMAQTIRSLSPETTLVLGGGYVNTELRQLSDPKIFDYIDFITLDDGEKPFLCILDYLGDQKANRSKKWDLSDGKFLRTFVRKQGQVVFLNDSSLHDIPHSKTGVPTYDGLPLDRYVSIFEMLNPMHRIWSDGRWNKVTLAHGCYWKKCSFCDVSLDYIGRYDPASADLIIDRIQAMVAETGSRGFHFVDEAAPPAILRALAERLLERQMVISWWGNIRFDKTFTPELTRLLARSGCVAVSGGLEVASNRLLQLMQKGVTVEQVARVTHAFTEAGVMVHAYLMYGFPTQTLQETVDALERVRQLFEAGCIQSGYWHPFSVTAHSPIGLNPNRFGIRLCPEKPVTFARNDLAFEDPTGCDHERLGRGLRKALYNYMHGVGFDLDVRIWFDEPVAGKLLKLSKKKKSSKIPKTTVSPHLIVSSIASQNSDKPWPAVRGS